jgi:hypothetical protein
MAQKGTAIIRRIHRVCKPQQKFSVNKDKLKVVPVTQMFEE